MWFNISDAPQSRWLWLDEEEISDLRLFFVFFTAKFFCDENIVVKWKCKMRLGIYDVEIHLQ